MKKLLFVFIFVLLTSTLFALDGKVGFGWQDKYTYLHHHDPYYVKLSVWQDIWRIQLYGEYVNEFHKSPTTMSFRPSQDYYTVGAVLELEPFTLTVEHQCYHPVICWHETSSGLNGGYTKVEISFWNR